LALLQNLQKLRDALYSPSFREFLRGVTGCGHLSGSKQDMSINSYRTGCHLLNHDDVIGSRRVSYILYMPLPVDKPWQPEWGGALELYPVVHTAPEPAAIPSKKIPPSWNQFIFFEVQPGASYHSVEEVVVGSDDGTERLSISGWFACLLKLIPQAYHCSAAAGFISRKKGKKGMRQKMFLPPRVRYNN
jgi:Rps23 Pro-64 3,4-dihydroxylase Tpa1-like proline 4-hydroxylase